MKKKHLAGKTSAYLNLLWIFLAIGILPLHSQQSVRELNEQRNRSMFYSESSYVPVDSVLAQRSVTLGELIQGQAANVKVTSADGAPGAAIDIKIRGGASLRGDFQPLYILDGIMLNPSQLDAANAWSTVDRVDYQAVQNMLWTINTQDIESIQILKDASATALYGSRGANGVIIIKTKSGSKREREVNWSSNIGLSTMAGKQDLLSASQYRNYYRELTGNEFVAPGAEIDWQNKIFRPAISHNHNLNMAGTIRRTNYYVSLMADQQTGLVPGTDALDLGLRINLDQQISDVVDMGIRVLVARNQTNMTQSTSLLGGSSLTSSLSSVPFQGAGENPWSWRDGYNDESYTWRVIPQGYFNFNFFPGFSANVTAGLDYINKERFRWMGRSIDRGALENGRAGHSWMQTMLYDVSANVTFHKQFDNHSIRAVAGGQVFGDDGLKLSNYASDFAIQTLKAKAINFASRAANPIYIKNNSTTYSAFGYIDYSYNELLYLQIGLRGDYLDDYDKSIRSYPFANAKVNLMKPQDGIINALSVTGGWGASGKNELITYLEMNDITLGDASLFIPYEEALNFKGRLLTSVKQFNIGAEAAFLNNRLNVSAQFYTGKTMDRFDVHDFRKPQIVENIDETGNIILQSIPYNEIYWRKQMDMNKWGIEATLSAIPVKTKDLVWSVDVNFGLDRQKITDAGMPASSPELGLQAHRDLQEEA